MLSQTLQDFPLLILDGALATELERRGCDLRDALWSARVLLDKPELIRAVHHDYFAAGADVATTASYQASYEGFARRGLSAEQATAWTRQDTAGAFRAVAETEGRVYAVVERLGTHRLERFDAALADLQALQQDRSAPLAVPYTSHGRTISDDVVRVTWTARTKDDWLPNAHYDEFVLVAQAPQKAGAVYWPVTQVCEEGRNDWTDIPKPGQKLSDLKSPAAVLEVLPGADASGHNH